MSQVLLYVLKGAVSVAGDVMWESESAAVDKIIVTGGHYLFLVNLAIDIPSLASDEVVATFSGGSFFSDVFKYRTPVHRHDTLGSSGIPQTAVGPRLIYQTPLQYWASALLFPGEIKLTINTKCTVSMIACKFSTIDNYKSLGIRLQ